VTKERYGLEQVFKIGGVPDVTFIRPSRWSTLLINLRTPGRGLVVEGPSGIGKTTAIKRALGDLGRAEDAQMLSGRRPQDVELIELLLTTEDFGLVVIDDFHVLDDSLRNQIADLLKALADEEAERSKLVIIGINRAGDTLIRHAPDVANRLEILRFEVEPAEKVSEMIRLGEVALNIELQAREQVIEAADGSFYIAQLLSHELCADAGVLETQEIKQTVETPFSRVKRLVLTRQQQRFENTITKFARGNKFRPGGRAPYVQILRWLQSSPTWTIDLPEEMALHRSARASVNVVLKNGYLATLVGDPEISKILHLDPLTKVLSVEDPQVVFYLKNLDVDAFAKKAGFRKINHVTEYDVALSFAGEDRVFARSLNDYLEDADLSVFFDETEAARILGEDLEAFFGPIYESEADYVVAVLGPKYGVKRWTRFESEAFRGRFEKGEVIFVWSRELPQTVWDKSRERGGFDYDPTEPIDPQAQTLAAQVAARVERDALEGHLTPRADKGPGVVRP
jgi:hypothetical protein